MILSGLRQLCALSVLSGVLLTLTPEGTVKQVTSIACTAVLVMSLLGAVKSLDWESYSLELAKYRELEAELVQEAEGGTDRLNRLVIEQQCETYILGIAAELGIEDLKVRVSMRWNMDGLWVPDRAELQSDCSEELRARLSQRIEAELGIGAEQQSWSAYG